MPPRENPRVNKSLDSVHASGPLGRAHCVIHGNSNYKQTGLLQAYAAYSLLQQPPRRVGFASGCQAFGHRELLGVLRSFGLVMEPQLTVHATERASTMRLVDYLDKGASLGPDAPCLTTDGRHADLRRGAGHCRRRVAGALRALAASRPGDKVAILSANDPTRVRLRLRHLPRRRGVVPGQPAQRGGREPRAARPLRLHGADLPGVVRAAGRQDPRRPARSSRPWSASTAELGRGAVAGTQFLDGASRRAADRRRRAASTTSR